MQIEELTKILTEEAGLHICPICATPFSPYNSRQKTCGSPECKREYHKKYVAENNKKQRRENPEEIKKKNRNAMRKYRSKQKRLELFEEAEKYWEEREKVNERITGLDYGKRSAEKTLAKVPKIDVNIHEEEKNE